MTAHPAGAGAADQVTVSINVTPLMAWPTPPASTK